MKLRGIGVKLVLMGAAILAAEVGLRSWLELVSDEENFRQDFVHAGQAHAMSVAQGAEYGLLTRDKAELERVAAVYRTKADTDLLYVAFYDEAGHLLAAKNWTDETHLVAEESEPVAAMVTEPGDFLSTTCGEYYRFKMPVAVSRDMAMPGLDASALAPAAGPAEHAMVVCARSYEGVKQRVAADQREMVVMSAAIFVGAILVLLAFSRRLVRPIRRLVEGTERIAGGDLTAHVGVGRRHDELGALADSFNRMTGQLQAQRLQIVSYSQDLERKVASRTAQLAEANTRMQAANGRLEALATTDPLTGLWNRRRFIEMLERECQRGARTGAPLALAMLDVDRFKAVNDTFGHAFGDRVLVAMADRLHHAARGTDVVARYGGEEFMVLMPDTTAVEAVSAAERIRKSIASHPISDDKRTVEVTVSIGVSALGAGGAVSPESLVRLADETLYAAKQAGRNCTKTWNEVSRDAEEAVQTQAGEVEELQRRLASLSLEAKDGFVQSVQGLVRALEARDPFSRSHSENVTAYAVGIAGQMGLEPDELATIRRAAWLHDIGKIGVPDAILRKPGALTDEEQRVMRQHVLIGVRILEQMRFLEREVPLIRHHHERWDGRGYPDGIGGQAIARGGRILAVCDAFDSLTSDRPYRKGIEVPDALRVLIESSGTQFDPEVIDALIRWVRATGHAIGNLGEVTPDAMLDDETRASAKE